MYVSAQRVQSAKGMIGINAVRYRHGDQDIDWHGADLDPIIDRRDERTAVRRFELAPGGNAVLSFIDVTGPDTTPVGRVEEALQRLDREFGNTIARGETATLTLDGIGIQFMNNRAGDSRSELRALAASILSLWQANDGPAQQPLRLVVTRHRETTTLSLDPPSQRRLAAARPGWQAANVSISRDVADAFEEMHGDVLPMLVQLATGLDRDALFEAGGVVLDEPDGRRLAEWPNR